MRITWINISVNSLNLASRPTPMLHSYTFSNFQSFRERAEVSMVLNNKTPLRGWEKTSPGGYRLSTALGILGANGAGKTAALKPLAFAAWFMSQSFNIQPGAFIPVTPHLTDADKPTEIEVEAEDDEGVLWRYVLRLTLERVWHEALYRKRDRFGYVFLRDWDPTTQSYVIKQQGFGFAATEARKVRPNASLISTAAQYGVAVAQHVASFGLMSNINFRGREAFQVSQIHPAAKIFADNENLRNQMIRLLTHWDLGLSDVLIREIEYPTSDGQFIKLWTPFGIHNFHGNRAEMPMELESSGTQSAFVLLSRLLSVLAGGGVALIDELENDLHPHMVEPVLDLFASPSTNPHGAQIIFTCHSPEVLDLLQKAQVMFVEKTDCESLAFRGDEIRGLRSDDNLRAKYLAGALGAVPNI